MPHKNRKVRKQRGSRTHGWGQVGQHRGGGMKGGRGHAGLRKHKWSYTIEHASTLLAVRGFNNPNRREITTINVGDLDGQIPKMLAAKQITKTKDGIVVDLSQLGFNKLLGAGKVTHPLLVRVEASSASASRKIQEAGGQIQNLH